MSVTSQPRTLRRRVVVVEDNTSVRVALCHMLKHLLPDTDIVPCAQGAEAITIFKHMSVDCILIDYCLDDMDGITLTQDIRMQSPKTVIILMSGMVTHAMYREAKNAGCADVLAKPFFFETLQEKVVPWVAMREVNQDVLR